MTSGKFSKTLSKKNKRTLMYVLVALIVVVLITIMCKMTSLFKKRKERQQILQLMMKAPTVTQGSSRDEFISAVTLYIQSLHGVYRGYLQEVNQQLDALLAFRVDEIRQFEFLFEFQHVGSSVRNIERFYIQTLFFFDKAITEVLSGSEKTEMKIFVNTVLNPMVEDIKPLIVTVKQNLALMLAPAWRTEARSMEEMETLLERFQGNVSKLKRAAFASSFQFALQSFDPSSLLENPMNLQIRESTGWLYPSNAGSNDQNLPTEISITNY